MTLTPWHPHVSSHPLLPLVRKLCDSVPLWPSGGPMREYVNPVYGHNFPDPFVLRFNGVSYAYGTGEAGDGKLFPMLSSRDMVEWATHGGALAPLADPGANEYWAPEVAYDNGVFYMY